ncbi:ATP-dependent acyl-CoA ligase [Actinomadura spongiicola]|uniref:ATP-dependent acyl-CoA ligase n=1 Tax=Actinomadura spongiicola TaxID=2303421 RepID=A0A372GN72_9ACTN|nr:AMP-binding protein [Actinomadura spongiicola]RFS86582.1 ATP-dependent acyl-CoA ligase [Actinomadura spongiicola]
MDLIGNRTLADLLVERCDRHPDRACLVVEDASGAVTEYTYRETLDAVRRTAGGFAALGVGHGDAVVIHLRNRAEFVFAWFGLAWLGAVMVPSNVAASAAELAYLVERSEAVGVLTEPDHVPTFAGVLARAPKVAHRIVARGDDTRDGFVPFSDVASGPPVEPARVDSEDVVEMLFTSGTTARPKAVMITHANCLWGGERVARGAALHDGDRLLTALPLFHINAQEITVLAALTVGGTAVLLEEYHASGFWSRVRHHGATSVSLVAMQLRTMLAQPPSPDDAVHRVHRAVYAINVTDREKDAFERRFGVELINGYGLSEGGTVVTMSPVFGDRRWPSIGLPNFDRRIRIVDEDGRDVPAGTVGEILVSGVPGRTLMKGYFKDPEATAAAVRDGWLHTGDNGYLDERGYVYFFDRKKDVIKRAGENVSASEVEFALLAHPSIAEAAVVAAPDPVRDEEVCAFVVPRASGPAPSREEIAEHCRARLAAFKVPTRIEVVDALPKTSIGKVEKKLLRRRL